LGGSRRARPNSSDSKSGGLRSSGRGGLEVRFDFVLFFLVLVGVGVGSRGGLRIVGGDTGFFCVSAFVFVEVG